MMNPVELTTYLCLASNILNNKHGSDRHGADYIPVNYMECISLLAFTSLQYPDYKKIINLEFVHSMFSNKRDLQTIAECILKGSTIV